MNDIKQNRGRVAIMVIAVIAVLLNLFFFSRPRLETADFPVPQASATLIPPEGVMATKKVSSVPGNPEATAEQMRQIYSKMLAYQKKEGCYPQSGRGKTFAVDIQINFREYGFRSIDEARQLIRNPDIWLSDDNADKKPDPRLIIVPYFYPLRPDGSSKCDPKTGPGRDILMVTDMYVHRNIHINRGDTTTSKPVGFYMVLWDDGTVEQIPWEKASFIKDNTPYGSIPVFAGQYGIEKVKTETFSEKYHIAVANK